MSNDILGISIERESFSISFGAKLQPTRGIGRDGCGDSLVRVIRNEHCRNTAVRFTKLCYPYSALGLGRSVSYINSKQSCLERASGGYYPSGETMGDEDLFAILHNWRLSIPSVPLSRYNLLLASVSRARLSLEAHFTRLVRPKTWRWVTEARTRRSAAIFTASNLVPLATFVHESLDTNVGPCDFSIKYRSSDASGIGSARRSNRWME